MLDENKKALKIIFLKALIFTATADNILNSGGEI